MTMAQLDERRPLLGDTQNSSVITKHACAVHGADSCGVAAVDSPLSWSSTRKWGTVVLLAYSAFCVTFGCLWVAPLATGIVDDLNHITNHADSQTHNNTTASRQIQESSAAVILVSIWELGEATGPLFIGPLSETFGRLPLYMAANLLFTFATALGAMSNSIQLLAASRALTGLAVAANVLNPAIAGDIFPPEQRGAAVSCITIAPLLASAIAPMTSSLVGSIMGWRAVIWLSTLLSASSLVLFLVFFRETYYPVIAASSKGQGAGCCVTSVVEDQSVLSAFKTKVDAPQTPREKIRELLVSIARPFSVFFGSGVLMSLSAFGAVCYSYFYIISTTMPNILEQIYGFPPGTTGWAFCANAIGTLVGVSICHRNLDRIYIKLTTAATLDRDNTDPFTAQGQPEYRLPLTIIGVLTLPPAVALYGWSATLHLPLPVFLVSIMWLRASMTLAALPLFSYIVDACGLYAASALTGAIVLRCLAGAFLPLATAELIHLLGYGWGFTVMAGANLLVGMVPIALFKFGEDWRGRSVYTSRPS